jgi:hypothetical protein
MPTTLRALTTATAIAAGAFLTTSTLLLAGDADAKYRRVTAATSCHEDNLMQVLTEVDDTGVLYDDDIVVGEIRFTLDRDGSGVTVTNDEGAAGEVVRCEVPTDSYLPHQTMTEAHVSGYKANGNGYDSIAKACYTWWTNGSYFCAPNVDLPAGNFNVVIDVGAQWANSAAFPMVTAMLGEGDSLYGVYYTDA